MVSIWLTLCFGSLMCHHNRVRLLLSIFEANVNDSPPGCGFELNNMMAQEVVLGHFPLHNYGMLKSLEMKWLRPLSSAYQQPIGKVFTMK
jgi:hypothetical protein